MPTYHDPMTLRSAAGPAARHFPIVPSDANDLTIMPRAIYCNASGTVKIRDASGTELSYVMVLGQVLPFAGVRVMATGTTATVYGWV